MEAPGEEVVVMGSKEHTQIVKGKRTKRQRPLSPIPLAVAAANSVSSGDGGGFDCINGDANNINKNCEKTNVSSSSTSNEYFESTTEEEEDMANCLILLAQGQSREFPKQADGGDVGTTTYKFNSRRFMETASTGNGKAGYYVYECKTCNRTFPSFQALGGHRASHKKPKPAYPNEKKLLAASSDEEDGQHRNVSLLSLQLSSRGLYNNNNNNGSSKGKVHECSICGAEFTSGQALGGHMRRHRGTPVGANAGTALSLTPIAAIETDEPKKPRNVLSLDLDLNLPAPEDDNRVPELPFASKREEQQEQQQQPQPQRQQPQQPQQQQQQSPLVFSAPALVGCHY